MIRLTIDNQEVTTPKGLTILDAAKNAGITFQRSAIMKD